MVTGPDLRKLVKLLNNVSPNALCAAVYGPFSDEGYRNGKANQLAKDALAWLSNLDDGNMDRLALLADINWREGHPLPRFHR